MVRACLGFKGKGVSITLQAWHGKRLSTNVERTLSDFESNSSDVRSGSKPVVRHLPQHVTEILQKAAALLSQDGSHGMFEQLWRPHLRKGRSTRKWSELLFFGAVCHVLEAPVVEHSSLAHRDVVFGDCETGIEPDS